MKIAPTQLLGDAIFGIKIGANFKARFSFEPSLNPRAES